MTSSRRRFLRLAAALSALAGAAPATLARAAAPRRRTAPATRPGAHRAAGATTVPPAIAAEIRKQKDSVAQTLKTLRDFPLPAGSDPAFRFTALRGSRREP